MTQRFSLRSLAAEFGFDSISVHTRFVLDEAALEQFFLSVLQFFPVSVITAMLHAHSSITLAIV